MIFSHNDGRLADISVVIPVYRSSDSLRSLVARIESVLAPSGGEFEIILVDDGSPSETWRVIEEIVLQHPRVRGLRLGRNYGQHSALIAGVRAARLPVTVTVDDDLQNPPEEIPRLVAAMHEQDVDVVYGVPQHSEHGIARRIASSVHRSVMKGGLGLESAPHLSSFRAFRTIVRDGFNDDIGSNVSLDALLTWGTSKFGEIRVRHDPRVDGYSTYTFGTLLRFAIDSVTGYSTKPLQIASIIGFFTALFGFIVLVFVTIRPLMSGQSVPGFPFLASTIAIFSGAQLLTLGIIGEYLARMHFRIMRKPTYVISETTVNDLGQ